MITDFFNAEFVELYLNNQLSAEDELSFDQKLNDDPDFSEFVSLYQDIDCAISEHDIMDLRNNLDSIHEFASEDWIEEAPMIVTDSFEEEIFDAIGEEDVMNLRATLNEIHDLNIEEIQLSDELSEVESMDMEELLSLVDGESDDFRDTLLEEEIDLAIGQDDVMDLRNTLGSIAEKVEIAKPVKRIPLYKKMSKLSVAASIALIISLGTTSWFSFSDSGMSPDKAVNRFVEPMAIEAPKRGGELLEMDAMRQSAVNLLRDGNYLGAVDEFKDLLIKYPETRKHMDVLLYIGNCYYETNQDSKAIEQFKTVFNNKETALTDRAEWYLAACYLRNDDLRDKSIEIFQRIARTHDHEYFEDNRRLLKRLKK